MLITFPDGIDVCFWRACFRDDLVDLYDGLYVCRRGCGVWDDLGVEGL